jgi:anti-sigma factor RsiW
MKCARASTWIQLYLDDRLSQERAGELQRHLGACAACREELTSLLSLRQSIIATDLTPHQTPEGAAEPADLTDAIVRRIAAYETRKALEAEERRAALERRPEFIPDFVPAWVGRRSIAVSVLLVALLVAALQPGGLSAVANTLAHQLDSAVSALLTPGPDQVSWAVWLAGGVVTLVVLVWFMRADASSEWRRAISERFPQLW